MKRILFYPCSGNDVRESVRTWVHIIDEFWFAEISYSGGRKFESADMVNNIRWRVPSIRIPNSEVVSQSETFLYGKNGELVPVKSFTYLVENFRKSVTLNFAGGCAVDAFECLPSDNISIFVNRGDHRVSGESSSGICWLSDEGSSCYPKGMLQRVLSKMTIGSFIVTDGSNATDSLAPYWNDMEYPADAHLKTEPLMLYGVSLRCVGMLEPKYGPTLVWQIVG